jgi:predicted PurR-regulated permease PerM
MDKQDTETEPGQETATRPVPDTATGTGTAAGTATGTATGPTPGTATGTVDLRGVSRFGIPGLPVNRGHPFYVGFMGALGVLVAYWLLGLLGRLTTMITLIVVALFLALGLDPVVAALQRRGLSRPAAVVTVVIAVVGVFVGFAAAVAPTLVTQATEFSTQLPALLDSFQHSSLIQQLDQRYGLVSSVTEQIQQRLTSGDTVVQLFGGVFGAGRALISGAFSAFTVLVLTLYFLASMQSMTEAVYRLVPASRRERVQALGDEIIRRIGAYIAGQVAVATINGVATYIVLSILGINYRLVLAIAVGLFGLIPLVGASIGAGVVVLVALFQSWQLALIVAAYYLAYQQVENYLISPRIMSRTVSVPGSVAVVAALTGGTLLGVVGALVAIPVAAGVLLIVQEVVIPRQAQQ